MIIAEKVEVEATPACHPEEIKPQKEDSPGPNIERPKEAPVSDTSEDEFELTWAFTIEGIYSVITNLFSYLICSV